MKEFLELTYDVFIYSKILDTNVCKLCVFVRAHPRFTELYVDELENEGDLRVLVSDYLKGLTLQRSVISGIIR